MFIYLWKIEFTLIYAKKYSKLSVTKYLRSETNLYLNSISLLVFIKICLHKYPLPLESILQMYVYLEVYVHTNKIEIVCFCHKYAFFFYSNLLSIYKRYITYRDKNKNFSKRYRYWVIFDSISAVRWANPFQRFVQCRIILAI